VNFGQDSVKSIENKIMTRRNISSEEISPTNISKNLIKCNLFKRSISTNKNTQRDKTVMKK